jgi:hypothetical protein
LNDTAVRIELDDRRRRTTALGYAGDGSELPIDYGPRPLNHPHMIVRVYTNAAHLTEDPLIGKRQTRPRRVELELGDTAPCGARHARWRVGIRPARRRGSGKR